MWQALGRLGFTGGDVLEPGCGSGHLIGMAPAGARMVGVERDPTSAGIAALLYPHAHVVTGSFADLDADEASFDVAIGNVPFGSYKAYDARHNPARHSLHNHFLIKALHLTRPGGLVVALTSRYTLDARNPAARREMRELADLVGAVRLPTNAHRRAAGTSVVTDLLILRRREPDQPPSDDGGWEWAVPHTVDTAIGTTGADPDTGETTMLVNRYFVDHPERILGVLRGKFVPDRGLDLEVLGDPDAAPALEAALEPIIAEAVERGLTLTPPTGARIARPAAEVDLIDRDAALYAGYLAVNDDGTFTRRVGTRDEPYTPPPAQADELRQLLGLRDHAMALVNAEVASIDDTPEISDLRARLNQAYDDYVAAYGPPSRYTQTRTMLAAFAVFKRWCIDNTTGTEHTPLPAAPDTVRAYLTHLRDAGVGADILTKHLDGITRAHQTAHNKQVEKVLDRIARGSDSSARERAAQVAADYPDQFLVTTSTADLRLGEAAIHAGREVIAEAEPTTPEEVDLDELGLRTTTIKRPPQGGFRHDPFAGVVRALEIFDPASGEARKEDIFAQRVINPPRPRLGADTAEEALSICLDTHSRVDLDEIARLLGLTDPAEARAELGGLVFDNPDTGEVEWATLYLSGNVRHKLTRAREAAQDDPRFEANVTALEEVVPPDLGPSDIVVQLGSWIEPSYVQQFLRQLLDDRKVKVERPLPSLWVVSERQLTYTATSVWGTAYLNAYELVESLLLGDKIDVVDEYDLPDGRTRTVLNVEETELARDKAAAINDRFAVWVFEDPDRAAALMRRYNELFNSEIPADFSTATLSTPGLASNLGIALRDHQIAAVSRMIFQNGVGLIHDVGAGKTLEIIVGVMERRRRGLTNKAVIVVRNDSIAEQFERQWRSAYPQAQLLVATSDDFTVKKGRDKRAEFVGRVATGSWDAVLITKDAFQRVPLSADTQRMFIEREVDDIRTLRKEKEGLSETAQKKTERALAAAEERLTARLDALPRDTKGLAFEQSGVDLVVVDEAQDFKNGLVISRLPDLGIVGSDRAVDLDLKLQWLAEQHHHACAVLATATPFTGKFSEVYLWFRRLGHDLPPFDEWARNFIVADAFTEITPAGQLRPRIRMRRMINEDDLWTVLRLTSDVRMADALNIPGLPELREGGVEIVTVPGSVEAKIHSLELGRREREIRDNPRQPTKGADNHLVINHHGMQAALDLRIRGISTEEPQKVDVIADDIYREHLAGANNIYRKADGSDHPVRGGLILAFCDESIPRPGWNFYQELKDQLVARGMREDSIRFVHEAVTPQAKKDLYDACRNGGVSLLIGSTQRMGAGLNVQDRLLGGYEIIPPRDYRADTSHQARGRVIRQGNQNETVFWKRVVLAPSLDAKKWEIVRQKHDLFAPLLAAHKPGRHRDVDDNESIDLADVMTAATGDPRYTEKAELDAEFKKLNRLQDGHNRAQQAARLTVADIERNLPHLHRELERAEQAATLHISTRGAAFSMTLQGNTITKRIDAAHQLNTILRKAIAATPRTQDGRDITVATLGGYTITAQLRPMKQHSTIFLLFSEASANTYVAVDHRDLPDGYGLITRLENMLDEIPKQPNLIRADIADAETTLAQARTQTDLPFPHTTRLAEVSARRTELTAELSEEDDTAADTHVDPDSPAGKARAARLEKRAKERAELSEQVRVTVFDADGDDPHSFADWYVAIVEGVPAGQRPPVLTAHKVWRELGRPGTVIRSGNTSASDRTPGHSPHTDRVDTAPVVDIPSELAWLAEAAMVSMVPARWSTLDDAVDHLRQVEALPWYRDMPQGWTSEHQALIDEITEARKTHLSPSGALIAYKAESPHTGRQAWYVAHTASGAQLGDLISDTSFDVATATRNGNSTAITLPDSMIPRYLYALDHRVDADGQRLDWTQDFAGLRAALAGWTAPLPVDTVGRFRDADFAAETRGMRTLHALAVLDTTAADPLAAALTGELIRIARWVLPTLAHTVGNRSAAPLLQALATALSSRYPADTNGNTREAKALRVVDEDASRVLTTTALWGFGSDPRKAIDLLAARIDALQGQHDPEPTLPADWLRDLVLHIAELHTPEATELERLLHAGAGSHLIAALPTEGAPADAGMRTWEITGRETAEGTHGGPAAQLTVTRHFDTDSTGPINGTITVDPSAAHPVTIVYDRPGPATDAPDHVLPALAAGHWMVVEGEQPQPESVDDLHRQSHRAARAYLDANTDNAAIEADHDISPTPPEPRNIAGHQAAEPTHQPQTVPPTTQNPTAPADTSQKQTTPTTSPAATAGTALEEPAKPAARATGNRRQDEQEASQGQLEMPATSVSDKEKGGPPAQPQNPTTAGAALPEGEHLDAEHGETNQRSLQEPFNRPEQNTAHTVGADDDGILYTLSSTDTTGLWRELSEELRFADYQHVRADDVGPGGIDHDKRIVRTDVGWPITDELAALAHHVADVRERHNRSAAEATADAVLAATTSPTSSAMSSTRPERNDFLRSLIDHGVRGRSPRWVADQLYAVAVLRAVARAATEQPAAAILSPHGTELTHNADFSSWAARDEALLTLGGIQITLLSPPARLEAAIEPAHNSQGAYWMRLPDSISTRHTTIRDQLIDVITSAARDADERYARAVREIARQTPIPRPSAQHTDQDAAPADTADRLHRTDVREADEQASNQEPRDALHAGRGYAALDQQRDPQPSRASASTGSSSLSDAGHEPTGTQLDQAAAHESPGVSTAANEGTNQNDSQTLNSTATTSDTTAHDPVPGANSSSRAPAATEPAAPGHVSEQQPSAGTAATDGPTNGIAPHLDDNGGMDSEFKNADRILTLHFSHQHGALLLGTEKADEIGPLLRSQRAGWKHSKRITGPNEEAGAWYLPQTHQQNRAGGKLQDFHHRLYRRITGAGQALADRGFTIRLDLHDLPDRVIDNMHAWLRGAQPTAEEIEHRATVTARVAAATERIRARVGRLANTVPDEALVQAWTDFASEHLRDDDLATRLAARRRVLLDALPAASAPAGTSSSESALEQEALETVREILTHETAAREVPYRVHTNKQRTEDEQADLLGAFAAYIHLLRERLTDTDELALYGAATDAVGVLDALGDAANTLAEFFDIDVPDGFPPPHLATLATQPPHPRVDLDALGETVGLPHWRLPTSLYPARLPGAADAVQRLPQATQGGASAAVAALVWQLRDGLVSSDEATAVLTRVRERDDTVFGFDRTLLAVHIGDVSGEITGFGFDLSGQVVLRGATLEGQPLVVRADPQTRWTPGSTRLVPPPDRPMQLIYRGAALDVPDHPITPTAAAADLPDITHPQPQPGQRHQAENKQTRYDSARDSAAPEGSIQDDGRVRDGLARDAIDDNAAERADGNAAIEAIRAAVQRLPDGPVSEDDLVRVGVTPGQFDQLADADSDASAAEWHAHHAPEGTSDIADDAPVGGPTVSTDPVAVFGVTAEHPAARYVRESLARLPHDPDPERAAADRRRVAAAAVDMYVMTPEGAGVSTLLRVISERAGAPESVIPRWLELRPEVEWSHWVRTLHQSSAVLRAVDGFAEVADRVDQAAELMAQRIDALAATPAAFQAQAGTAGIRLLPADHPVAPPLDRQLDRARYSHHITGELRDGGLPLGLAIEVLDGPGLSADELAERACYGEPHSLLRSWDTVTQLRYLADVVEAAGYTTPLAGRDLSAPALWRAVADGVAARLTDRPLIEPTVPAEVPELVPTQPRPLYSGETATPVDRYLAKLSDGSAHREDVEASRAAAETTADVSTAMLTDLDAADPDRVQSAAAALQQHAADHALLHLSWALDDRHTTIRRGVREAWDVLYQLLWPEPGWDLQRVARRMITFADDDPARLCGALVALARAWRTRAETGDDLARLLAQPPVAAIADQLETVADHLATHWRFARPPTVRIRGEQASLFDLDLDLDLDLDTEPAAATGPVPSSPPQATDAEAPEPDPVPVSGEVQPERKRDTPATGGDEPELQPQMSDSEADTSATEDFPEDEHRLIWHFSPRDGLYMLDTDSNRLGPWLRQEPVGWKHSRRITGPTGEVGAWYLPGTRQWDRNGLQEKDFERRLSDLVIGALQGLLDGGHAIRGSLSELPQPIALDLMRAMRLREAAETSAAIPEHVTHANTTPPDPVDPTTDRTSNGADGVNGTDGAAESPANSGGMDQPATVDDSESGIDEHATEEYPVIEGLTDVSGLFRTHRWDLVGVQPVDDTGAETEHWRRHDVSIVISTTPDDQVLTRLFIRHGPWESDAWDEVERDSAQFVRELIEHAGLRGVARPARLPGLWRVEGLTFDADVATYTDNPDWRLVTRPADGAAARDAATDDSLDDGAGRWVFEDGTTVPLAPPLPQVPVSSRQDLTKYVLGDRHRDKELRRVVQVVISGRAYKELYQHDARDQLATADPEFFRRALTASVGQPQGRQPFDVARARHALERLAEGDPTLPLNSIGQYIEFEDWFSRVRDEEGAPLPRGVVVDVRPEPSAGNNCVVSIERDVPNAQGEIKGEAYVAFDAVLTLLDRSRRPGPAERLDTREENLSVEESPPQSHVGATAADPDDSVESIAQPAFDHVSRTGDGAAGWQVDTAGGMAEAALAWWDAGCSVVRVETDGSKRPVPHQWAPFQRRRATREEVGTWFLNGYPGIGVVTGAVSGNLEMIEFEGRAIDEGLFWTLRTRLEEMGHLGLWDKVVRGGYKEGSPSGGMHVLYRVEGDLDRNTRLAQREARDDELTDHEQAVLRDTGKRARRVLIETRGEGGFVVVAPSHGSVHDSGRPWERLTGTPSTIPAISAAERDILHMAARDLDQIPAPPPIPEPTPREAQEGVRPGDDFNDRASWAQVLEPHGWVAVGGDATRTYWRRPGKDRGVSAVTGGGRGDYLWVWSTSTALPSEQALSKWRTYGLLDHGGDFSAAARALANAGYGDRANHAPTGRHRDRPAPEPNSSTTDKSTTDQARSESTTPSSPQPERAARTPQVLASLALPKPGDADTVTRHTGIHTRSDLTSILRAYHNGRQSGWWPLTSLVESTGIGHQLHVATQSLAQVREATRRLWPVATDYGLGLDIALDLDTLTDAADAGVVVHLPRLDTLDRDTTAVVAALNGFRTNPDQIPGTTPIAGAVSHRRVAATAEHIPAPTSPATTAPPTAEPDTADVADSSLDDVRHDPDELFAAAARRVARMLDHVDPAAIAAVDRALTEQSDRERAMLTLWARIPIMDARLTPPVVEIVRDVVYSVTWREHLDPDLRARTAIATGYGLPTATTLVAVAQELTQRASGDDPLAAILHRTDATEIVARLYAVADRMAVAGEFLVPHRPNLLTRQVTLFDQPAPDTARPGAGEPRATEDGEPEPDTPTDTSAEPPPQPPPDEGSIRDAVTVDGSADEQNADASPTPAPIALEPETPEHEPPGTGDIEGQGTPTNIVNDTNSVNVDDNLAENDLDDVGDDEAADDVRTDTTRPEASPATTLKPPSRPESSPQAPAAADVLRRLLSATRAWPKQLDAFLASTDPFAAQDLLREIARRTDDDPHIQVLVAMAWRAHHGHATDAEVSAFADRLIGNDPSTIGYALGRPIRDPRTHQLRTIHAIRADIEGRVVLQGTVADSTTTLVTLVDPDAWLDPNGHEILPAAEAFADRPEPTRAPTAAVTTTAAADTRRSKVPNPESRSAGQPSRRDALDRITLVPADDPAAEPVGDQLAMGRHTGPLQLDEPARLAVSYVHRILRGPAEDAADLAQTVINVGHRGEAEQVAARLAKLADKIESAGFTATSIAGEPTVPLVLHLRAIAHHVRASLTRSGTTPAPKGSVTRAPTTRPVDINPSSADDPPVARSLRNDAPKAQGTSHRAVPGPDIAAIDGPETGGGSASSGDALDAPTATTAHQDFRRKDSRTSSGDKRVGDFSWPTIDLDLPRPREPAEELSREPTGQPTRRVDVPLAPTPGSEVMPADRSNGMVLTGSALGPPDAATAEWVRLVDRASRIGYSVITAYDLDSAVDEPNRVIRIDGNHDPLARVVDLAHKVGLIEATASAARTPTSADPADATPIQASPPNQRPSDIGRPVANTAGRRRVAATAAQLPAQPLPPSMTPVFDALVRELGWSPAPPGDTSQRRTVAFRRAELHQATPTPVFDQLMSELGWQQTPTTATNPADADTRGPRQTYVAAQNRTSTGESDGNRPTATAQRGHVHDEPAIAPGTTTGMPPGHRPHMPVGWALETAGTTRGRSRR